MNASDRLSQLENENAMNCKSILLGTLFYVLVTFPIAIIWHLVLFEQTYLSFGYFQGEPNIPLGFITILIQGIILSALYPYVRFTGEGVVRGLKYSLAIGAFFWTSHVLAFIAKQSVSNPVMFALMETFYLLLQFGIFGVLIGFVYKNQIEGHS